MTNRFEYTEEYYQRRENSPTFQAEIKAIIDFLQPTPNDIVVELGCGSGVLLSRLSQFSCRETIGMDWLSASVKLAANRTWKTYKVVAGDAENLPFQANSIDKMAAQHLIEHFKDTTDVLLEWRRVLRTGGKLVLVTPNRLFPYQSWFDDPTHCHIFTRAELAKCAEEAGFKVDELLIVNPYFFHWRFNGFVARHLQILHRLPYIGTRGMSILLCATKVEMEKVIAYDR